MIRILFVGNTWNDIYVKAFYNASCELQNIEAELFSINEHCHFKKNNIFHRFENKYAWGPDVYAANKELTQLAVSRKYDIIFFYTCRLIYPETVKKISEQTDSFIMIYNNDNPFSSFFPKYFWRHFIGSLKYADMAYAYREANVPEYKKHTSNSSVLRSYYIDSRNYYIDNAEGANDIPEVVFMGHSEDDYRIEYVKALVESGVEIGLPRKGWEKYYCDSDKVVLLDNTGERYNEILNKAKIAIVFLSTINHDTYTRRCFEIPVVKTMMIAPYTDDLATLFEEDKEIVFFRNEEEFVEKIKYYLVNGDERERIAQGGYNRVIKDGHEAKDRIRQIVEDYNSLKD